MRTAIDTNVICALLSNESSVSALIPKMDQAKREGAVVVCAPVWAELHAYQGMSPDKLAGFLHATSVDVDYGLRPEVWRESGLRYRAFAERRRRSKGDSPRRLLTDFVIGAHALLEADRLLTLDVGFYERNFPGLALL